MDHFNKDNKNSDKLENDLEDWLNEYGYNDEDLSKGQFRLLEVDKKLVLPINSSVRLLITSDDVLHSWAVPALGVKVDACPGRINELVINSLIKISIPKHNPMYI